ncbi:MAG: hemerythrin domain-containing protein [Coriobacteriia bacterium]|nr:hemerythrin domain-containing protein [Coriobacteriia bacterium]
MESWDESLETGDPLVDQQHRRIYRIFYELEVADDTPGEIMLVLDRLTSHVALHFRTEEDLMRREEFPAHETLLHQAEHRRLTEQTRAYVLQFRTGELSSTAPLIAFLREWLHSHVESCDRVLVDHVRARGGAARLPAEIASSHPQDNVAS